MESATKMKSASVVRSPATSPTDLSLCSSKRKAISHQSSSHHHHHHHNKNNNNNNNNSNSNSKRFRLSEAAESAAAAEAEHQQQQQQQQRGRSLSKSTAVPATSSGASSPSRAGSLADHQHKQNAAAAKMLGMPDQNTASMLAAMAFVTRARSSFMIGDILNSSRWTDPSPQSQQHGQHQHHHHPLLGAYHHHQGGSHPAATAAALMAASAAAHHHVPQHLNQLPHGLHGLHHHHHLLQHPSVMEAVHHHHQSGGGGHKSLLRQQRDGHSSKSDEEEDDGDSEVDVESNASYNSRQTNSREFCVYKFSFLIFMGVFFFILNLWMALAVIGRALSTHLYH
jgi:hypothetical protein